MNLKGRILVTLLLIGFVFVAVHTQAAEFPSKPINVIVPFAPGGITDVVARLTSKQVEKYLGQPLVIVSKTGGSGAIGFREGATAKPDGYTITVLTTTLGCAPHAIKGYPITYKSFDPLVRLITYQETLVVSATSPWKTVDQFVQFAKSNPGKVRVGEAGYGSNHHFAAANFGKVLGLDFALVPYTGSAETTVAVMGGHLEATFVPVTDAAPLVKAGKLTALVTLDQKRAAVLPDVPSLKEVRIGNPWAPTGWIGFGLPKGTPAEVRQTLYNAFKKATADKELIEAIRKFGLEMDVIGLDEFGKWMGEFHDNVGDIAKKIDLKMK
jgi:tripartite-type tricarboxylate transporter receptor subunit TctC